MLAHLIGRAVGWVNLCPGSLFGQLLHAGRASTALVTRPARGHNVLNQ
jgi:hypothetical protein